MKKTMREAKTVGERQIRKEKIKYDIGENLKEW